MRWWFKIITARRNRTQYRIPSHHRSIRLFVIHIQILLEGDTTYTEWKGEREWMGRKMLSCVKPVNPSGLTFLYDFFFIYISTPTLCTCSWHSWSRHQAPVNEAHFQHADTELICICLVEKGITADWSTIRVRLELVYGGRGERKRKNKSVW